LDGQTKLEGQLGDRTFSLRTRNFTFDLNWAAGKFIGFFISKFLYEDRRSSDEIGKYISKTENFEIPPSCQSEKTQLPLRDWASIS